MDWPHFFNLIQEVFEYGFTSWLSKNIIYCFAFSKQISTPKLIQNDVTKLSCDPKFRQKLLPMFWFHGIVSKVHQNIVHFLVVFKLFDVCLVNLVSAHFVWKFSHFILFGIYDIFHGFVNVDLKRSLIDLFDCVPNLSYTLPNLQQINMVFLKTVEIMCIPQLHI